MVTCPSCGAENADGARFCSACGDGLEARSPAREERKVVSILFVDLVGFTASSDGADPEDVRDLLRAYHAAVKDRIEHYGGTLEKFVGDAVMAVFGAPVAHTDDAERAVRAGLRALEAVEELREARGEPTLAARAGVTTGEAVVTVDAGRAALDVVALGDVVNTAARLQTAAPPSRLLVAEETYRATREAIRYEPIPDVRAKGKADPVPAWLAVEPMAAPAERTIRATPLVGRERELSLLRSVWERATSEGNAHLVSVVGPPGIGKSRLSREFAAVVEGSGGRAIRGRSLPYDARDVYGAFAQQLRQLAGIFEQDPPEQARQKLARTVDALLPEAERQEMTRSLSLLLGLGIDQPVDDQILLFYAARRLVERLAAERPLLLVFEDVHWADAGQLDLIEYLAAHTRDAPVVFLALARPEFLDTRAGWGARLPGHTTVTLDPVSPDDAAAIVAALVGPEVPSHAVEPLVEVAEGNPLFLEELTAALLEGVQLGGRLPTTVRAAIAARVDALVPEQRAVLLTASVVGRAFWVGVLGALGVGDGVARVLDALEAKDLVRREPTSRVGGDVEFSFKHQLIRDVCYATLPRAERTTAHAAVARYIESVAGEQERELAWLLAHHWEGAGDRARSVEYLLVASDRAREALAADDAVALLDRALELTEGEEAKRGIRLRRAMALTAFEDFDRAAGELETLIGELEGVELIEALLALARASHWTERTLRALDVSERARATAARIGAPDLEAAATARLSQAYAMRGEDDDLQRAIELGEAALRAWPAGARSDDLAEHEHLLADQYYWTGQYARALDLSRAARDEAVDPTSAEALLRGGGMEGLLLTATGRYEEAFRSFDRVIALGRDLGRPVRVLLNYSTMAFRQLFDLDEARRRSEEAFEQGRSTSFHMPWMNAAVDLVETDLLAGELGAATSRWNALWQEVIDTPAWERWLLGGRLAALRAEIALPTEGAEAGVEWADRAVEMARTVSRAKYEAAARATLGAALVSLGRAADAVRELTAAVDITATLGSPYGIWRARRELARALERAGNVERAERELHAAAEVIGDVAAGLSPERRERFLRAPAVAEILGSV